MTTEEELKDLQRRFDDETKRVLREKRIAAAVWGVMSIIALLALVYAFFQQTDANMKRILAEQRTAQAETEVVALKKQILQDVERLAACERVNKELQMLKSRK